MISVEKLESGCHSTSTFKTRLTSGEFSDSLSAFIGNSTKSSCYLLP